MDTKALVKKFSAVLWVLGVIILGLIIVSWFVDYPRWLDQLLTKILLFGLGIICLYQSFKLRQQDTSFSMIYLVLGLVMVVVAFLDFDFLTVIAVIGLGIFILTRPFVKKKIEDNKPTSQP
jgi:putative Mn2+ efflux pump MntP